MRTITKEVAALLRERGYDAWHGQYPAVGDSHPEHDYVVVRAVTVVGWRCRAYADPTAEAVRG